MELYDLFRIQKIFDSIIVKDFYQKEYLGALTEKEKIELTKDRFIEITEEMNEMISCLDWKRTRYVRENFDKNKFITEFVDIMKYLISLMNIWEISPKEFEDFYIKKSSFVIKRYEMEKGMRMNFGDIKEDNIIILDLDGVLADYVKSFCEFSEWYGYDIKCEDLKSSDLTVQIGSIIGQVEVCKLKEEYRKSGYKANMFIIKGAKEFTYWLKNNGFYIIILTRRPIEKYPNLESDTLVWLNNKDILYDAIFWDNKKDEKIILDFVSKYGNNKKIFVIDDEISALKKVCDIDCLSCILLGKRDDGLYSGINTLENFDDIIEYLHNNITFGQNFTERLNNVSSIKEDKGEL